MSEHTAEPWICRIDETVTIRDSQDNQLGILTHLHTRTGGRRDADEVAANARRIVACVNACKGIKTEALARIADLEAELSRKDECIVDGLMQRKDLQSRLAEATKFIQDIADGGGFTGAAAKDFLENTHD